MKPESQSALSRDQSMAAAAALGIVVGQWWIMTDLQIQGHWVLSTAAILMLAAIGVIYLVRAAPTVTLRAASAARTATLRTALH